MSQQLISRNPPLKRLRDEGYVVSVEGGYIIIRHVPYVTPDREVKYGILTSTLEASGDVAVQPSDHTVRFVGETPCTSDGVAYEQIINQRVSEQITPGMVAGYSFSSKPPSGRYMDYHEKMTTYVHILESQAREVDSTVTAQAYPVIVDDQESDSVFNFMDTASSRAGINAVTDKLKGQRIAIIGVGGTGSYILDLVAKTPVVEIHLYDADRLLQHNAFRMPGALSSDELQGASTKVAYLTAHYSKLRRGIVAHECRVDASNVQELADMDFVFLSLTDGSAKQLIVAELEARNLPFVDVGMGIYEVDGMLGGQLRVTTSTPSFREHVHELGRIPFTDGEGNEYAHNIQIADLNALNATLAVIKWKKLRGFYLDLEREHFSVYAIDGNHLLNEDRSQS